jgi:hypothetical protein
VNIGYNETIKLKLFAFADTVNLVVAMASLAPLGQPIPDQVYADLAAAKLALQEYARLNGFSVSVESSNEHRVFYICSKGGKYKASGKTPTMHDSRQRKNTSTMKTGCP